jgi:uncharacterized protein YbjT (DUF2867 family)
MDMQTVVVCGATGHQGGAVVRKMIQRPGWHVTALSRNPDSPDAEALKKTGVTVLRADLDEKSSLLEVFSGAQCVFGVTQPWSSDYKRCNPEAEIKQGRNVVDACLQTGVNHLVLSTASHREEGRTGIPHVDSKLDIVRIYGEE